MRHILNNIIKLVWFIISNILFPVLVFVLFIVLENSLLIQTSGVAFNSDLINLKGNHIAININTSFFNNLIALSIACVSVVALLKIMSRLIENKILVQSVKRSNKLFCREISAYNGALSTEVSYLRI